MPNQPIKAVYLEEASFTVNSTFIELFDQWQAYPFTPAEPKVIIERLQDAQVAICNKVPLTAEVLKACPSLQLILVTATGTNNIDLEAAKQLNITVSNCQGYCTASVTQHAMMLLLALAGNLLGYHQAVKENQWQQASHFCLMHLPITELSGKTLGIIGYGELGRAMEKIAQAFGMNTIIAHLPNRKAHPNALPLNELLPQVDALTIHCPLTDQTKDLLTEKELRLMKPSAFLINTARGGIVNEQALANVLRSGHLGGAGVDVLSEEPPKHNNPLLSPDIPRLIITPHCAWSGQQAQINILKQLIENVQAFIQGNPIRVVN